MFLAPPPHTHTHFFGKSKFKKKPWRQKKIFQSTEGIRVCFETKVLFSTYGNLFYLI